MNPGDYDVAVIGGGIVGLATAWRVIASDPALRVVLLEKEPTLATHQSGRNSGVVHSGIYYPPGSVKARLVAAGRQPLIDLCERHGLPIAFSGKVIVATHERELPVLRDLAGRGAAHGLAVEWLDAAGLRRVEPHAAGIAAVRVPEAGCTDFHDVAVAIGKEASEAGVDIRLGTPAMVIAERPSQVVITTSAGEIVAGQAVVCAGLQSGRLDPQRAADRELMTLPFRGEYYELEPAAAGLVRTMIYPVPDPRLPFLGVHLTRSIDGVVHIGPNAVPALAVEGYRRRDVEWAYVKNATAFPGTRRLARRHWRSGVSEIHRSLSKRTFTRSAQRLLPGIQPAMMHRSPAGVRAQAVRRDGTLVDDFAFRHSDRVIHVDNAPSPAATAALAIGAHIRDLLR